MKPHANWTFDPPFPIEYSSSSARNILVGAEPNGDADRPHARDMGEWLRFFPKSGTKFYRAIISIVSSFEGTEVDLKNVVEHKPLLQNWRFIDLVSEEAGPQVEGDFISRVRSGAHRTVTIIEKDEPSRIVLLGSHAQRGFEDVILPLLSQRYRRVGLPHPSSRGGYVTRALVGNPNEMLRATGEKMLAYSHLKGWR